MNVENNSNSLTNVFDAEDDDDDNLIKEALVADERNDVEINFWDGNDNINNNSRQERKYSKTRNVCQLIKSLRL